MYETLSLAEFIQLQDELSKILRRRFERDLAVGFADIVGSTAYFEQFGDEAGRRLQQRHVQLTRTAVESTGGRIVDAAGDGAFVCFPTAEAAAVGFTRLQRSIAADNTTRTLDEQMQVRIGVHFGPVLTDGTIVTGDVVNIAARITATANPGEIRMSRETSVGLPAELRLLCKRLEPVTLKGVGRQMELLLLAWHDEQLHRGSLHAVPSVRNDSTPHPKMTRSKLGGI